MTDTSQRPERRVVVCFHERYLGGATRSVERIVPLLESRGWKFSFWAPKPSELYDELAGRGWDVDGTDRYIEYSLRAWRLPPGLRSRAASVRPYLASFRTFLRERSPALVHANSIMTIAEALTARRRGLPTLLHVHEMVPAGLRGRLLRLLAWRRLDQVVAVSGACAETMARGDRRPLIVHEAAPVPTEPVPIRAQPDPFTVGTVAVVSTRKGSDLFVEAASRLLAAGEEIRFEMVGPPNDELEREWAAGLVARAAALGIEHTPSADVPERLRSWDAFALPSRADPFPIALLEAMVAGLPVIGAARDGILEQITDGTGVLVAPEDPGALAAGIARVAALDGPAREALGRAARRRVVDHFTLEHQAAALDSAYRATLAEGVASEAGR